MYSYIGLGYLRSNIEIESNEIGNRVQDDPLFDLLLPVLAY